MKYLYTLKDNLINSFTTLTPDKTFLLIVNGELAKNSSQVNYIARFILTDCREDDPFLLLTFIRQWFASRALDIPDLSFDCDVIDLESYDLQIDIALFDKLNIASDGSYAVCLPPVWSDELGTFINGAIVAGDLNP